MRPKNKERSDTGENTGLRVFCRATGIKTFFYRYSSPVTHKLVQLKIGNFPQTSLSEARVKLQELKQLRQLGRCPVTELKEEKQYKKQEQRQPQKTQLTVKELVELYLVDHIEDRKGKDGKIISGSRKKKGQKEVRRMLEADAVRVLGELMAHEVATTERFLIRFMLLYSIKLEKVMLKTIRGVNLPFVNIIRSLLIRR